MRFLVENISDELFLLNLTPVLQESEHDGDVWGSLRCFPSWVLSKPIKVVMCTSRGEETSKDGGFLLRHRFAALSLTARLMEIGQIGAK